MVAVTLGEAATLVLRGARTQVRARGSAGTGAGAVRRRHAHRTGAPVRRDSIEAGTFEDMFFAAPAKGETDRLLRLARAALDAGRRVRRAARTEARALTPPECALAAISAGTVRVYEEICALARLNRGRVYPSYDRLAEKTALGRATIARALDALEDAGFLVRQRRFRRVEGEGAGPRWEQTSNAYRLTLPARIMALLPRWLRPAPLPADVVQHQADEAGEMARLRGQLSCRELAQATLSGPLARALARLGSAIDVREGRTKRESHPDPEPFPQKTISGKEGVDPTDRHANPVQESGILTHTINDSPGTNAEAPASPSQCSLKGARGAGSVPRLTCRRGDVSA